jgi:hypothetical protein
MALPFWLRVARAFYEVDPFLDQTPATGYEDTVIGADQFNTFCHLLAPSVWART